MSQPLVFITGATGFIGQHVVQQTLAAGYKVRLSVRKEAQIDGLRNIFSEHVVNLDFAVISDFTIPSVFDNALENVTYIFHLASPMPGKGSDFKTDYLDPAVQGTIALLDAAKKVDTVKRVVIVSSLLALIPLDARDTLKFVAREGLNQSIPIDAKMSFPDDPRSSGGLKYHASKILAHRATLEWTASAAPSFHVITLHPSFVFGRNLMQKSADALDGTNAMLWGCLHSPKPFIPMSAVDVRDVASAHLKALGIKAEKPNQVEEFILSAGEKAGWTWGGVVDFVRRKYPSVDVQLEGPFDKPPSVDTQRAEKVLGVEWRKMEDTVSNFLDQQLELRSQL